MNLTCPVRFGPFLALVGGALLLACPARGLIFFPPANNNFNTTPPTGDLADSGWQWEGQWGQVVGTPVAPNFFIAASHVAGRVGNQFTLTDPGTGIATSYTTINKFEQPGTDLTLWEVGTPFTSWAPLYTRHDEVGQMAVVFGRGSIRGVPVEVPSLGLDALRGWKWDGGTGPLRWGQNTLEEVDSFPGTGDVLIGFFNRNTSNPNEVTLAGFDSSGGLFLRDPVDHQWKLAGINYAADSPFRLTADGTSFDAALFDAGGLYVDLDGNGPAPFTLITDTEADIPTAFYVTRISANVGWINSIIAVPEPGSYSAAAGGMLALFGLARALRR